MILMIDNYDSFTYNLVQYLEEMQHEVVVYKNDQLTLDDIRGLEPDAICISPGPGKPEDAGISVSVIQNYYNKIPILGICLGHQAIIHDIGGKVVKALRPMHGKREMITHDGKTIYKGLPVSFQVTRYHSLIADPMTMPRELEVSAYGMTGEIMSIRHTTHPIEGMQYHPESILTDHGKVLLKQFFDSAFIYPVSKNVVYE